MASRRNLQSSQEFVNAISTFSSNRNNIESSDENNEGTTVEVEATIRKIFPCTRGQSSAQQIGRGTDSHYRHSVSQNNGVDRGSSLTTERFIPTQNYGWKKRKRTNVTNKSKAKYGDSRTSLKDVILLPGPNHHKVPRGYARESLFSRGFTTTIELDTGMSEDGVRRLRPSFQKL